MSRDPERQRVRTLLRLLARAYPDATCTLAHQSPYELLVATVLSAQCTDERVNQVTPALFQCYPTVEAMAAADQADLEALIFSTGFYRNKARNLIACCRALVEKHGGLVPADLELLVPLPGIGRKTANVILGDAFGIPGITVDTHVGRLSRRLGLSQHEDPVKVEQDLMALIPTPHWTLFSHRLILHGRRVCAARRPNCGQCVLSKVCPRVGLAD